MSIIKKIFYTINIIIFLPWIALAAPNISNESGSLVHGQNITISGSDFGTKSPAAPVWWDDGENRTIDNPAEMTSASIWGGRHYQQVSPFATNQFTDISSSDSDYHSLQYRDANFRGVAAPHARSTKYISGGHSSYKLLNGANGYRWILSGNGTNEYYVELSAGGNPNIILNTNIACGSTSGTSNCLGYFRMGAPGSIDQNRMNRGIKGSLADHHWDYGDNDSLGYNTFYFRDESGDPDTTGVTLWGGTSDLAAGYTGANVMAMVCVPPQGGMANCSTSFTWEKLYSSFYMRFDPLWPVSTANANNEKLMNFEAGTGIYVQPDYYSHGPEATLNSPFGVGLNTRCSGINDRCTSASGGVGCFTNPKSSWLKQDWVVTRSTPSDTISTYVRNGSDPPVLALDQSCDNVIHQSTNLTGLSIGGYYCHADYSNYPVWQASTSYPLGAIVKPATGNYVNQTRYEVITAGTSGGSQPAFIQSCSPAGPNFNNCDLTDGSVVWRWRGECAENKSKDSHPNAFRYYDDIYVDNTHSRIMLCNNATYASATICEPQIPSAWTTTSATAKVNLGKLPNSGTAYLFVFDFNNEYNSVGFPVTIGSGDTTPPSTPQGLSIN